MVWTGARKLILPTALTVTTFAAIGIVVSACGGDDDDSKESSQAVVACSELPSGACELCKDDQGKTTCGPYNDCYKDIDNKCHTGSSG